jgi:translation initiation factor IF-1
MDVPAMFPGDDYAGGVVVELLPNRRCRVRLNDGREVVGRIPHFANRHNESYYPATGHEVTVFLREYDGEYLLVGFPLRARRST